MPEPQEQQSPESNKRNHDIFDGLNKALRNPLEAQKDALESATYFDGINNFDISIAPLETSAHFEDLERIPEDMIYPITSISINRLAGVRSYNTPYGILTSRSIIGGRLFDVQSTYFFNAAGESRKVLEIFPITEPGQNIEDYWENTVGRDIEALTYLANVETEIPAQILSLPIEPDEYELIEGGLRKINNNEMELEKSAKLGGPKTS